ncbi:MAG: diaminopimelate epimerase [Lewinellaceae bacterium]|nr:diaminopimelate epimerase [Lewinellaceae bacterium]
MATFNIIKCHGSGNDFVLIDERRLPEPLTQAQRTALAVHLCNRNSIIGADSFLFVQDSAVGDGKMRYFNADGSEANMSGNGLRCVARYVSDVSKKDELVLEALGGVYTAQRVRDFFDGVAAFSIKITTVDFAVKTLPLLVDTETWIDKKLDFLSDTLHFTALTVPNPQLVARVTAPDEAELIRIGSRCNDQRDYFTEGVNVNFFIPLDERTIFVQTYERGCGITFSCGTGMFASSIASTLLGHTPENEWITVLNQGGFVKTKIYRDTQGKFIGELLGNTTNEFTAELEFDFENPAGARLENVRACQQETNAYTKVQQFASERLKALSSPA